MPEAVIVDAVRTPGGRRNGQLSGWHPADLAAECLNALVQRNGLDPALVEDVIMGCVMQVGAQSVNIARNAVLAAGWPEEVPATTIDRQCGSSQQAAHFAAQARHRRRPRHRRRLRRRGHEPGADGCVGRRRQVRPALRPPGRPPLLRGRRPRAPGHLGRADRRQVGPLPRRRRHLRRREPAARAARARDEGRFDGEIVPVTGDPPRQGERRHQGDRRDGHQRRGHPRRHHRRDARPTSSPPSSPTARSRPATPARSPTAPRPR